jgi:hypothetical protein
VIKSRNIHPDAEFGQESVNLSILAGASLSGVRIDGWRAPWPGKIVSAHIYAAVVTDADDTARVDLHKNAASILSAAVDPVASDTATALSPTDLEFNAGDVLKSVVTTGAGDALSGSLCLIVRPYLGYPERQAEKNAGESITV